MEKYLKFLKIKNFRGLKDLELNNLNNINVIVGDNNSGKTSLLETILMSQNYSINNILSSCSRRTLQTSPASLYNNFLYIFPRNERKLSISIEYGFESGNVYKYSMIGNVDQTIFNPEFKNTDGLNEFHAYKMLYGKTINQFNGVFSAELNNNVVTKQEINMNAYESLKIKIVREKNNLTRVCYLSPVDYAMQYSFNSIIRNEKYKKICIEVLKVFDKNIEDILLVPDEYDIPIQTVKHKILGNMPLSTYGDGIKRIVNIAGGIAAAHDGILLIDEFETAIHVKNYQDIFRFLQLACKQYKVQLFITTHSIEAIDALLSFDDVLNDNNISFITLRKDEETGKTLSRTLSGNEVKENREKFGFEVRL